MFDGVFVVDSTGALIREVSQAMWRASIAAKIDSAQKISQVLPLLDVSLGRFPPTLLHPSPFGSCFVRLSVVLDRDRRIITTTPLRDAPVPLPKVYGLIMAGGFGRRLGELTKITPKPMLKVAGKPIAEHLVNNLVDNGVSDIFFSLHHLGPVVRQHFGNGSAFGARIQYVEERTPLGTAGCLSLLPEDLDGPLVVVNGDIVTDLQFARLIDHHLRSGADVTMSVRQHQITIPYGVVTHRNGAVVAVQEKPKLIHDINVALYVLSPEVIRLVSPGKKTDMPDLVSSILPKNFSVSIFPMIESWIDVGSPAELQRAGETYDPRLRPPVGAFRQTTQLMTGASITSGL